MNTIIKQYRCAFAIVLFILAYILLYPFYRYVFDADAIGYLMVARRFAAGDWYNAINGYWSPLHSWLAVPFIKAGMNEFVTFRILNAAIGAGILLFMHRLLNRMSLSEDIQIMALLISVPVIISFCYYEVAADVLLCMLLLAYVDIITSPGFFESPRLNILAGVIACMAYLAKTYALAFVIVHFTIVQLLYYRNAGKKNGAGIVVRNLMLGCGVCLLLAMPWAYVLYRKYHFFTWGYAGKLNFSWQLTPPEERMRAIFMQPVNASSPAGWEDPISFTTGKIYHSFSSWPIFLKQVKLIFHNSKETIKCFSELSFLSIAIMMSLLIYLFRNYALLPALLFITILLLPLGYLTLLMETRFIWTANLLLLIAGAWLLQHLLQKMNLMRWQRITAWSIFFTSFLVYPADALQDHWLGDKDVFEMAQSFRRHGITGKFVGLNQQGYMEKAAYLSGTHYYGTSFVHSEEEILAETRREQIHHMVYMYSDRHDAACFKKSLLYTSSNKQVEIPDQNLIIIELPLITSNP